MKQDLRRFTARLLIFSVIVTIAAIVVFLLMDPLYRTPALYFILLFFFVTTLLFHYFFLRAISRKPSTFVYHYMALTLLKLLLYFTVILVYVFLIDRADAINFTLTFFIVYVLFTIFEVVSVLRHKPSEKT